MKARQEDKVCGIYCIRNKVNNKVYIGKSKNIYLRIIEHKYLLKRKDLNENPYLINAWEKYGSNNFEYYVIETLPLNDILVAERELYWIKKYNSLDKTKGYNLRLDSDSKMIVHEETRLKISKRLKKEWDEGIRKGHSEKLKKSWENTSEERRKKQSTIMKQNLTKWNYIIKNLENNQIIKGDYQLLKELKLHNVIAEFHRKKTNISKHKKHLIERITIDDIV